MVKVLGVWSKFLGEWSIFLGCGYCNSRKVGTYELHLHTQALYNRGGASSGGN